MTVDGINTICFVGAGTMGCYNSIVAAISGYAVVLYDVDEAMLERVPERHQEMAAFLVANGYCPAEAVADALLRVALEPDLARAVENADLVSESIFERLDLKREIHFRLDQACPPRTILTTNSSALLVSDIEDVVSRGDRFAALHSHLGAPLVDIVAGPRTDSDVISLLERYVLSLKGVPLVLKKEHRGYVLNAMIGPLLTAGLMLVTEGVAPVEDVDRAWIRHRSAPMGPFGMMDLFGLDLIHDTWRYRPDDAPFPELRPKVLQLLQPYVDSGALGMKSGRGFYRYPEPAYQLDGFTAAGGDHTALYHTLAAALIGSAVLIATRGVADPADIDRAWKVGTYLDAGPFEILDEMGTDRFREIFTAQVAAGRIDSGSATVVEEYLADHGTAG